MLFLDVQVGRLVFEFGGAGSGWESEVVSLLEENKDSVLGGGEAVGAQIVGSSLSQVKDQDARELFSAMAVAAEDVLMPLVALELVWCSCKGTQPPLGRLGRMKVGWFCRFCLELQDACLWGRTFLLLAFPKRQSGPI